MSGFELCILGYADYVIPLEELSEKLQDNWWQVDAEWLEEDKCMVIWRNNDDINNLLIEIGDQLAWWQSEWRN